MTKSKEETTEEEKPFERDKDLNIHQRINAIMGELNYIKKDKDIKKSGTDFVMYSVTGHDAVTKLIHPFLVKYGVNIIPGMVELTQEGNRSKIEMTFCVMNIDNVKEFFTESWFAYGIDPSDKGPGKGASYCQRQFVIKLFHLETGDKDIEDDDIDFEGEKKEERKPATSDTITEPTDKQLGDEARKSSNSVVHDSVEGERKVSKAQAGLMYHKFKESGFDDEAMKKYLQHHYSVEKTYSMSHAAFKETLTKSEDGELMPLEEKQDDIPF